MSDPISPYEPTESEARDLIAEHHIIAIFESHPAVLTFVLGNGQRLSLWDAGYEHGRHWELHKTAALGSKTDPDPAERTRWRA